MSNSDRIAGPEQEPFAEVPVIDTETLPATWRGAPRRWGHSLHELAPYVGGYPASLAYYFISRYTDEGHRVLDPFCGGGTTPLEAIGLGREGIGNDAFSYARVLSSAKCNALHESHFEKYLNHYFDRANNLSESIIPEPDSDIEIFYHEDTLDMLLRLRELLRHNTTKEATFFKALVCGILHGPSRRFLSVQTKDTFSGSPNYVRKYLERNDIKPEYRDIRERLWEKYDAVTSDGIPALTGRVTQQDSRNLHFESESFDFILTSPPYMHVLSYTWNNWLRIWWLGHDRNSERDELVVTSDIEKYRSFIANTLDEMYRVLSPDSRAVIIIGDVKKRRAAGVEKVRVAHLIAKAAESVGFGLERVIDDGYGIEKRSYKKFNEIRYDSELEENSTEQLIDRCIILCKGSPTIDNKVVQAW